MENSPNLVIGLFGGFRASANGQHLASLDQPRLQRLLVYLLLHRRTASMRSEVAFTLWPDTYEEQALKNLRTLLTRLRQALPEPGRYLEISPQALNWKSDAPASLDVAAFETAYALATAAEQAGRSAAAIAALEQAVDLYSGDLLPGWYDEWLIPERERLLQAYLDVLERLAALLEGQRRYKEALDYARRLVRADPLHESAYGRLMLLHLLDGDRAGALRVYHNCATILRHELGVDPGPATQAVYQQVLLVDETSLSPKPSATVSPGVTTAAFVGRKVEWNALTQNWHEVAAGQARVVLLSGEAGIGKTRLAEELLAWVERQGVDTAVAHCYGSGANLAYAPLADWLRSDAIQGRRPGLAGVWLCELARLLPDLLSDHPELPAPGPMTEDWQRQRFFQALLRAFLGSNAGLVGGAEPEAAGRTRPLLLLLDDVQWCDQETLDWLHYLIQAASRAPVLLLGTVRTEEAGHEHPLTGFRLALERDGRLSELFLAPLSEAETTTLAADLTGHELDPIHAGQLFRDTEGNPLFVVETVLAGLESGRLGDKTAAEPLRPSGDTLTNLPPKVRAVIQRRLLLLSPNAHELAQTAAVIGRDFPVDVLIRAAGREETFVLQGLDELWQRQLVREKGHDAYDFSHDRIRAVAYAALSPARRKALHLQVARALEARRPVELDPVNGQVADHYERAGRPVEAIAFYRRAAAAAQALYANAEADRLYRHLLDGDLAGLLSPAERCELMVSLGEVWRVSGRWAEAEAIISESASLGQRVGDQLLLARARRALADVIRLQGHYDVALEWLAEAEAAFQAGGDWRGVVSALWTMGETLWFKGDNTRALEVLKRQLALADEKGDPRGMAEALDTMGMVYWSQGDWALSLDCCHRSIATAEPLGYQLVVTRAMITIGNVYSSQHAAVEAVEWYLRAGRLARQIDDRQVLCWATNNIAGKLIERGYYRRALAAYERGLRLSIETGDRWTAALGFGHIAHAVALLQHQELAETLRRQAISFLKRLGALSYLGPELHDLAQLLADQGRPADARPVVDELARVLAEIAGQRIAGEDTRFKAQLLGVRLRAMLAEIGQDQAAAELQALLTVWLAPDHQAALHYELWLLDHSNEVARTAAADLFQTLHAQTGLADYQLRVHELTGRWLPEPPPLPDVTELIPDDPPELDSLADRLTPLLAQLEASFQSSRSDL